MIEQIIGPEYLARHHYNQGRDDNPYPDGSEDYKRYEQQMEKQIQKEDLWESL